MTKRREIKFRLWSDVDQKMYDMDWIDEWMIGNLESGAFDQFTGLKDKNGKEIYEGDIVKWYKEIWDSKDPHNAIEKVYFEDGSFKIGIYCLGSWYRDCEVIGDIYENSDLLN